MGYPSFICKYEFRIGCDPELFIVSPPRGARKRKRVVGSDVVIPPDGIEVWSPHLATTMRQFLGIYGREMTKADRELYRKGAIVRDGVQVELHPMPTHCRALLGNSLQTIFRELKALVEKRSTEIGEPLTIDFSQMVTLTDGDIKQLSPDARRLGCNPSLNIYGNPHIEMDGSKYKKRSGAGHLHIGSDMFKHGVSTESFVRIMELLVGIPCVLIDRDPAASVRRRTYGRAGEYRLPDHGVEYRTPSNFWLRDYRLMSLITGQVKNAVGVAQSGLDMSSPSSRLPALPFPHYKDADKDLLSSCSSADWQAIERAINTNDFNLAWDIYTRIVRPFSMKFKTGYGIDAGTLYDFETFVERIRAAEISDNPDPMSVWFKDDPLTHWITKPDGHNTGWEAWSGTYVRPHRIVEAVGTIDAIGAFGAYVMGGGGAPQPPDRRADASPPPVEDVPAMGARIVRQPPPRGEGVGREVEE